MESDGALVELFKACDAACLKYINSDHKNDDDIRRVMVSITDHAREFEKYLIYPQVKSQLKAAIGYVLYKLSLCIDSADENGLPHDIK